MSFLSSYTPLKKIKSKITDIFAASFVKAITAISFVLADVDLWKKGEFRCGIDFSVNVNTNAFGVDRHGIEADDRSTWKENTKLNDGE